MSSRRSEVGVIKTCGDHLLVNGVRVEIGANKFFLIMNFNAKSAEHGLVATLNGDDLIVTPYNKYKQNPQYKEWIDGDGNPYPG